MSAARDEARAAFAEIVSSPQPALAFLRRLAPNGPWTLSAKDNAFTTRTFTDEPSAATFIGQHDGQHDLYWTVNSLRHPVHKKPTKADILDVRFLHVDIDPPDNAREGWKKETLERLTQDEKRPKGVPAPSLIIFSGRGFQAFWKLETPIRIDGDLKLAAEAERYNQQLSLLFDGDHCHNIDRVMRLPGTVNTKNGSRAYVSLGR